MSTDNVYRNFYRISRLGGAELSDGGGPFGFDITTALEFDFLIERYGCDAVIETGCNAGDTTEYLARTYPMLSIVSCDIVDRYVELAKRRVGFMPHTHVEKTDSREIVARYRNEFRCPLYYLDAHWYEDWPLERELELIEYGIVCIDDFNIGHPGFGFDSYNDKECGPALLSRFAEKVPYYYTNNPDAIHELPCLQQGRRGGKAYFPVGLPHDHLRHHRYFKRFETPRSS
jgi:hypothetical protein